MNAPTVKSTDTPTLLRDPNPQNMSEFLWRLGLPVSALILAILAIPLSFVNPRAGRSLNLILAILIYMIYNNSLSISQAWVAQGKLAPLLGIPLVHGVALALVVFYFRRRLNVAKPLMARFGDLYYRLRRA